MDIDPINRKMKMKKVAGFHSLDRSFLVTVPEVASFRNGLGIKLFQNEGCVTLSVAYPIGFAAAG